LVPQQIGSTRASFRLSRLVSCHGRPRVRFASFSLLHGQQRPSLCCWLSAGRRAIIWIDRQPPTLSATRAPPPLSPKHTKLPRARFRDQALSIRLVPLLFGHLTPPCETFARAIAIAPPVSSAAPAAFSTPIPLP